SGHVSASFMRKCARRCASHCMPAGWIRSNEFAITDPGSGSTFECDEVIGFDPNRHGFPQMKIQMTAEQSFKFRIFRAPEAVEGRGAGKGFFYNFRAQV